MKKIFAVFTLVFAFLMISCGGKKIDTSAWLNDFEDAKIGAQKENKDILLVIGTADTISQDENAFNYPAFKKNVLESKEFISELTKKYVLVDYEFSENLYSEAFQNPGTETEKNVLGAIKLGMLYAFEQLPGFALLNKDGFLLTRFYITDKVPSNVNEFFELLNENVVEISRNRTRIHATEEGSLTERIDAMDIFFESTPDEIKFSAIPMSKSIIELDKNNESGLVEKHIFNVAQYILVSSVMDNDVPKALRELDELSKNKFLTPEGKQEFYYSAGYFLAQNEYSDYDVLIDFFQKSYDAKPDSENAPQILQQVEYAKHLKEAKEEQDRALQNSKSAPGEPVDPSKMDGIVITPSDLTSSAQ